MKGTMKAVAKVRGEENGTGMITVEIPRPGPDDVLIKIRVASICGTDVHIFNWDTWAASVIKPPIIYGHEFAGDVVEVGSNVKNVNVGDYVSGECHVACGYCFQCLNGMAHVCQNLKVFGADLPGIFAEYAVIPASNVWSNDRSVSPELCSIQDPFGNAVHSVFSTDVVAKDVFVLGAGPIGLMCVSICKRIGARQVFVLEKSDYRLGLAKSVAADRGYKASDNVTEDIMKRTGGKGVDVVLEMSGSAKALDLGLDLLRTGGDVILLGVFSDQVTLDFSRKIIFKCATLKGIYGRRMFADWYRMRGLLANSGIREDLNKIITHHFRFEQFFEAMQTMRSGQSGKVVLHFS